jgi:rubrerythrin
MSLSHVMLNGWRRILAAFDVSDHQTLLEALCDAYRMEANTVVQCTRHADQMHYPQFRAELLRIAAEVQAHLPWLHEQILALGGYIPSSSPTPILEGNSWECLRRDVEEARRGCVHLLEWTHRAERAGPEIAVGLQRIRKDKLRHREEFRQMFMKSDPYTVFTTGPPQAHEARQQQAWLEQRKNEWMDHELAEWEIEGKQTPWAEWSGEQEFKWATELPHHDREWTQHLAEQREADQSVCVETTKSTNANVP